MLTFAISLYVIILGIGSVCAIFAFLKDVNRFHIERKKVLIESSKQVAAEISGEESEDNDE